MGEKSSGFISDAGDAIAEVPGRLKSAVKKAKSAAKKAMKRVKKGKK